MRLVAEKGKCHGKIGRAEHDGQSDVALTESRGLEIQARE
jgi:hypothetical protein